MLSLGMEASRALEMASARRGLPSGSPPPSLAATVIARASFVKSLPRRESTIAFLCYIPAHLECPAMSGRVYPRTPQTQRHPVVGERGAGGVVARPAVDAAARMRGGRRGGEHGGPR